MPLVAAHAGISWWGTIATQLVVCVVSVQASFALDGLGCPDGPEETWPSRSMCNGAWEYVDSEGYNSSVWFPREWCERCNHNFAVSVIALCFVVLPHLVCLLLVYLTLRARMQSFAAEDVIKREAVGLRHACAVLRRGQGGGS
jgi:hypothetical protein